MNKFASKFDDESLIQRDSRDGVNKINKKNVICVVGTSVFVLLCLSVSVYFTYNPIVKDQAHKVPTELPTTTEQLIQQTSTTTATPVQLENPFASHRNYKLFDFFSSFELKPRVQNGHQANLNEYPWHVAIIWQSLTNESMIKYNCGGSLISDSLVLTAGHCIPKYRARM